jgi:hypothetical protein
MRFSNSLVAVKKSPHHRREKKNDPIPNCLQNKDATSSNAPQLQTPIQALLASF